MSNVKFSTFFLSYSISSCVIGRFWMTMLISPKLSRIHKLSKSCTTFSNETLSNSHYRKIPLWCNYFRMEEINLSLNYTKRKHEENFLIDYSERFRYHEDSLSKRFRESTVFRIYRFFFAPRSFMNSTFSLSQPADFESEYFWSTFWMLGWYYALYYHFTLKQNVETSLLIKNVLVVSYICKNCSSSCFFTKSYA